MSYNITRASVHRVASYLEALLVNEEEEMAFEVEHSSSFAYKVREAMASAQHFPDYSRYHNLKNEYKILVRPGVIVCRRKPDVVRTLVPILDIDSMQLVEITSLTGILGAAIKFKDVKQLVFPNADLLHEAKVRLDNWTATQDWQYIDHHGAGLTLTKKEVDIDLLWTPEDES